MRSRDASLLDLGTSFGAKNAVMGGTRLGDESAGRRSKGSFDEVFESPRGSLSPNGSLLLRA